MLVRLRYTTLWGPGFAEKVYENAMGIELERHRVDVQQQVSTLQE